MKKMKFLAWGGMVFALCAMLAACSGSDEKDGGDVTPPDTPQEQSGTMKYAAFYGTVRSHQDEGDPAALYGVKVTSGDQQTTTDANGYYQFDRVKTVNGRAVLKFEKKGFMSVVRSVPVQDNMHLDVTMKMVEATAPFPSSNIHTLNLNTSNGLEKMIVDLPADCYVTENGTHYDGTVTAEGVYLDPDDANFATQMPGDLNALRTDQSEALLISYGMVAVELKGADGEKLNLAPGQKATLSFPIPDAFKDNTPESIPLWSFNEETGLWEEEGVAVLTGGLYVGQVEHFSWHNLDAPNIKATVNVTVKDANGKALAGVPVDIHGQRLFYTDQNGKVKCDIPNDCDVYFRVPSDFYGNYAQGDPAREVKQTVNYSGGTTHDLTLTIPAAASIVSGKVTNTGAGSKVCSVLISYYDPDNWWQQTKSVVSDVDGNYLLYAPVGFTGPALLIANFADGSSFSQSFELTGADQVVNMTVSSESNAGSGVVTIWNDDLGIKTSIVMPAPKNGGYWEAVRINGSKFGANFTTEGPDGINFEKGETVDMINFNIYDGYSPDQTSFKNAQFRFMREGGPHLDINANGPAEVTLKDGIYTMKMTAVDGSYGDQMKGFDGQVRVKVSLEFSAKAEPASE